jgi:hypothetical protein
MRLAIFFCFLVACFSIFSCSHNPYENFQKIQVGSDKAEVLDKIGSPLRSHFQDGKSIWTYRFYSRAQDRLIYKDIILDGEKVSEIKNAKEVDIKEIERKEKMVEESLKETIKARESGDKSPTETISPKPVIDDSILNDSSKKKDDDFKPVD